MNPPESSAPILENPPYGLPIPGWACVLGLVQTVVFATCLTVLGLS